jgi:PBP4 family serine-type D-alanyl-D-alanine carboxypeptidase
VTTATFWFRTRRRYLGALLLVSIVPAAAQDRAALAQRVKAIIQRPVFRHARFGIAVLSLDDGRIVYSLNAQQLFTPASTTKLLTEGTTLALLGRHFRFHTRVYRTGAIDPDGVLHGDLVLVASGDPNLSGRIRPDGTLSFTNEDHSYDGSPDTQAVDGNPLQVLDELAQAVARRGIRRIEGRVLVDNSLFPEGDRELGTGAVISPICVNDNLIDVTLQPGRHEGDPVRLQVSPVTRYLTVLNQVQTGPPGSPRSVHWSDDQVQTDGSHRVTLSGTLPAGGPSILYAYRVPEPRRFAEISFAEALERAGVQATAAAYRESINFASFTAAYTDTNLIAEHVSPPLAEEIKVTLKVSQNLHASMMPFILGAVLGHAHDHIDQAGFDAERAFLEQAGLDLSGASQSDGAGGSAAALFSPDFMVHFLAMMARRPDFVVFHDALPVLGHDGTLWNIQTDSPAAGHVFAKTGTYGAYDRLNRRLMVTGKGLAGYMTTPAGHHLAFAIYANGVGVPADPELDAAQKIVGQALGEIATAIYMSDTRR